VDLTGANLSDADLQYVDLSDSTLKKARLGGATLKETRLTGANLAGAIGFRLEQFAQTCGESSVEVTLTEGEGVDRSATFGSQTLRRCAAQLDELRRDLLVAKAEEQQADTQQERTAAKQRTEQIQQQVQAAEHDGNAMRQDVQKLAAQQGLSIQQLAPSRPEALSAQRARDIEAAEATATAAQLDAINRCASYGEDLHAQATVLVTFENSGKVSEARVLTRPFAGTRKGSCLQSYFGRKAMRPFSGAPISVKKTFYL
jgi:hypothetical protein